MTELVHINLIKPGDTIRCRLDGRVRTVCKKNIGHDHFFGKTLFGDSYNAGHILVERVRLGK